VARAQPLVPLVCDPNRWIGGKAGCGGWTRRGRGEKRVHLSPHSTTPRVSPGPICSKERGRHACCPRLTGGGGREGLRGTNVSEEDGGIFFLNCQISCIRRKKKISRKISLRGDSQTVSILIVRPTLWKSLLVSLPPRVSSLQPSPCLCVRACGRCGAGHSLFTQPAC